MESFLNKLKKFINRKAFNIVNALIGATQVLSIALVTYFSPKYSVAINSNIIIVGTAAIEVCSQFVKN